jgi:hypothetical protein
MVFTADGTAIQWWMGETLLRTVTFPRFAGLLYVNRVYPGPGIRRIRFKDLRFYSGRDPLTPNPSVGIRFPAELRPPDRPGYGDSFSDIRSATEMEIGTIRRRNKMRVAPRTFTLQWTFTQAHYAIFDYWWQHTIQGGLKPFDIKLLDDDETLVWYGVTVVGGTFRAEIVHELEWRVSFRVKALAPHFGTNRLSGTDELNGRANIGLSASGNLFVYTPFYAKSEPGLTATGVLNVIGMIGEAEVGMYQLPRGQLA